MRFGLGGTLVLLVLSVIFGKDFLALLSVDPGTSDSPYNSSADRSAGNEPVVQFISFVLDDAQQTWHRLLPEYRDAKLVLFSGVVQSGCGVAQSATGPFYCPMDRKVYIDLGFFDELKQRFGAPGEFAQAYVLAHEIGHHVQNLLGVEQQVRRLQQSRPDLRNELSVRTELQADCFAGVWGHSTQQRNLIDQRDVEAGLNAAAAIGDDRLQRMSRDCKSGVVYTRQLCATSPVVSNWFAEGNY